jgi:hypothetical protein
MEHKWKSRIISRGAMFLLLVTSKMIKEVFLDEYLEEYIQDCF